MHSINKNILINQLRKYQSIIRGVGIAFIVSTMMILGYQTAWATDSCTAPSADYGTDTMSTSIPAAGSYTVWTHLKIPNSSANSVLLNVSGTCYNVGGSTSIPVNTWEWIDYYDGNSNSTIVRSLSQGNQNVELIGTASGVRVDQVEFVSNGCTPASDGSNCTLITTTGGGSSDSEDSLSSPSSSGSTLKSPASSTSNPILKVQYYLNNKLKATITTAPFTYHLNTKKILNGTYTLETKTIYTSGKSVTTSQKIVIKNPASLTQLLLTVEHYAVQEIIGLIVLIIIFAVVRKLVKSRRGPTNTILPPDNGNAYESLVSMYSSNATPSPNPQPQNPPTNGTPNGDNGQKTQLQ